MGVFRLMVFPGPASAAQVIQLQELKRRPIGRKPVGAEPPNLGPLPLVELGVGAHAFDSGAGTGRGLFGDKGVGGARKAWPL